MTERRNTIGQGLNSSLKAIILVGGEGTRLRPLTYYMPKPMVPVLNHPFLAHVIAYLKKWGVQDIILALSYFPEVFQSYFGDGSNLGVNLVYSMEDSPLGTAGAVKNAKRYLNSTFVVLNGDAFTDLDIADMLACHQRNRAKVSIALTWVDNPCAFGVVETDSDGKVKRFVEKPSPDRVTTNWINAGIYILEPEVMEHVPANEHCMFERWLFPHLLELNEPVYGYPFSGYWLDMGTPEKYLRLNCDLLRSEVSSALVDGLSGDEIRCGRDVIIHPSARIAGPAIIGSGCRISQGVHVKGPVAIGSDCYVGEGARLEEAVLWTGVSIGAGARLKRCIVGGDVSIRDNEQVINRMVTTDHSVDIAQE